MRLTVALLLFLLPGSPLLAQNNCTYDLKPLKPITPTGCADTESVCICNSSGTSCHWEWACTSSGRTGIDTSILLQVQTPAPLDPLGSMLKIMRLREMAGEAKRADSSRDEDRAPTRLAEGVDVGAMKTLGLWNGHVWLTLQDLQRWIYIDAIREALLVNASAQMAYYFARGVTNGQIASDITGFYEDEGNRWVPIHYALWAARLKAEGADSAKLKTFVSALREALDGNVKISIGK